MASTASVRPSATTPRRDSRPPAPAALGMVGALIFVEFCSGMLQGWMQPLLTAVTHEFEISAGQVGWVTSSYLLAAAIFVPVLAKLGDKTGHRRMLAVAIAITIVGAVLVATAPNYHMLILGRVLIGALTVFLPLEFAIVRERGGSSAGLGIGLLVGSLTLGVSVGGILSGQVMDWTGDLRTTLWIPVIFMTICLAVPIFLVKETTTRAAGRIDWPGAALLGIGLAVLLYGLSQQPKQGWSGAVTGAVVGGVIALAAWVLLELRVANPLVDVRRLSRRLTAPLFVVAAVDGFVFFGLMTMYSIYAGLPRETLGYGLSLEPVQIGYLLAPPAIAAAVAGFVAARLAARVGHANALGIGMVLAAAGYASLATWHGSLAAVLGGNMVASFGIAIAMSMLPTMLLQRSDPASAGINTGMYNMLRTSAGSLGTVVFGMILSSMVLNGSAVPSEAAFSVIWLVAAVLCLVTLAFVVMLRRTEPATD